MSILVLGVGNILLSDEAIGVRVVEALAQRYHLPEKVEVLDGGTAGMELMEAMANREQLIIVDAVVTRKDVPGSVICLHDNAVPTLFCNKISPHQLGLSDVLSALRFTGEYPKKLTLIGVIPASLEPHIGLTPVVSQSLESALDAVLSELSASGVALTPREARYG